MERGDNFPGHARELGQITLDVFLLLTTANGTLVHCHSTLPAETRFETISVISGLNFRQASKYPQPITPEK